MSLNTEERILIEQRLTNDGKSPVVAYLPWFFLGGLGLHRFYLGATGSGVAMLLLFVLGWLTLALVIGFALLLVFGIWWLVDAFLIPGMVQSSRDQLRQRMINEAMLSGGGRS
jgi:TM2 domain-containing membrane protein YozV